MQINNIGFPAGLLGAGSADPATGIGFAQMLGGTGNAAGNGAPMPPAANDMLAPAAPLSMAQLLTTAAPPAPAEMPAKAPAELPPAETAPAQGRAPAEPAQPMGPQLPADAPAAIADPAVTPGKPPMPGTDTKPAKPAADAMPPPAPPIADTPPVATEASDAPVQGGQPEEPKSPIKRAPRPAGTGEEPIAADPATAPDNAPAADMAAAAIVQAPPHPELVAAPQPAPARQLGEVPPPTRKADPARGLQTAVQGAEPATGGERIPAAPAAIAGKTGEKNENAPGDDRGQAPIFSLRHDAHAAPTAAHASSDAARPTAVPPTGTSPAATAAEPVVAARPGHLGQALGVEIAHKVEAGEDMLRVRLSPDNLGKVEVTLSFDDAGTLRATVRAESAHALDLLRQDAPDLGRALDQAGIRADAQSFRFESRTGDGSAQAQQQQQQRQNASAGQFAGNDEPDTTDIAYRSVRGDGQVDLLA
ncbi:MULTISPECIES: flagellar hook-length control protein FliK [unclassified Sphingomonas]|nr:MULTISPECIES: flagellar hook-length control protein FliK [unclassified Sphingomonas]